MDLSTQLAQLRREYEKTALDPQLLGKDPIKACELWLAQALAAQIPDPSAMTIATVDPNGQPSLRVVLLKGIEHEKFIFFTHYHSHKALDLAKNPRVALHFFWPLLERQLIIHGQAQMIASADSDRYFDTRPRESQISAWASQQSQIIPTQEALLARQQAYTEHFAGQRIPRPQDWGGYAVYPHYTEFWQGRAQRLHDRIAYQRTEHHWTIQRLAP